MYNDIIEVKRPIVHVDDIINQEYHTYTPYTTSFNNNDEMRITIQSQDLYVLPCESYLSIEYSVARNGQLIDPNVSKFVYLFITHLFAELRYELNGFEIDCCKKPGITCLMKMLTATKNEDKMAIELLGIDSNSGISAKTYNAFIPLRFLFGFCDDFNKIILNSKHELIMVRSRTNANMYTSDNDDLQFDVKKIQWKIPHVSLSDKAKLSMLKTISRSDNLLLAYRSWDLYEIPSLPSTTRHTWSVKTSNNINKPRYVIVGFQTNRNQNIAQNSSLFDHCNITNMKLYLNNERYPYDDLDLDFVQCKFLELYHMYSKAQSSYYNGTSWPNPFAMFFNDFDKRPLFVFDCSKTEESIKPGMVDVRLDFDAKENFPTNTTAYCLIIHDNLVRYSPFTSTVRREV